MTLTMSKTVVEPKWTTVQIQENIARVYGVQFITAMNIISKFGPEAVEEFQTEMRKHKIEHFKSLGVKTPAELVKAMAEFEVNVFGSKVEIWGDEKQAFLKYNSCAMWNAVQKYGKLTPKQEEEMGSKFEKCTQNLAKELGFKAESKFEGETCVLSFSK
jgi:hypothetical protein